MGFTRSECQDKPLLIILSGNANKTVEYFENGASKISYFSLDEDRLFFIEANAQVSVCGKQGHVSQHPNVFVTEGFDGVKHRYDPNYSVKNIDSLILHGMQFSLLYNDVATQITKLYNMVQYQK